MGLTPQMGSTPPFVSTPSKRIVSLTEQLFTWAQIPSGTRQDSSKVLPTEVTVISHIACTYLPKKAFEARLRDGRPKFRNAAKKVFKAKQNKATEERLRGATFVRSSAKPGQSHHQKKEKQVKPSSFREEQPPGWSIKPSKVN